uniref:Uncharacterized protein n=1 Tax=Nelumbo nucifera TaxID=4432 RepID=A0A822ZCN4_NELNU|nr:TPA_asm: hypothetical protein HUJ06_002214 [Nelumbo nucifera]
MGEISDELRLQISRPRLMKAEELKEESQRKGSSGSESSTAALFSVLRSKAMNDVLC